jgi:hypothetical protein
MGPVPDFFAHKYYLCLEIQSKSLLYVVEIRCFLTALESIHRPIGYCIIFATACGDSDCVGDRIVTGFILR